jgi:tellurite resistance protein
MIGVNTKTITRLRDHLLVEGSRKSVFMAGAEALEHPLEGDEEAKDVLDAVAEAMYLMISADGVIAEAEREVLRGALRELTVGAMRSALIEQLLTGFEAAKAKEGQEARMNAVASVLAERPEAAEAAFVLSAAVAFADNEIADEENDVLNGFAEKLGISSERAEELLDGLEADGADLITALSTFFDRPSSASPAGPHAFSPDIPRTYAGLSIPRLTLFPGASTLRALSPG